MSSGLSPDLVLKLMDEGQSQTEIAREYGVTRQYVSKLAKKGGYVNKFRVVSDNLPWEVHRDFAENTIYKNLRRHGIAMAHGFDELGAADQKHLQALYKKIAVFNVVVDYDPEYPALPGFSNSRGFAFLPRLKRDRDFIVRIRPGMTLSHQGKKLWRLPADLADHLR